MKYNRIMKTDKNILRLQAGPDLQQRVFSPGFSFYSALPEAEYCRQMDFSGRDRSSRPFDKQPEGGIRRGQINKERIRRFPALAMHA